MSLSFFRGVELPSVPGSVPERVPVPVPTVLFGRFVGAALRDVTTVVPVIAPVVAFLVFVDFVLWFPVLLYSCSFSFQVRGEYGANSGSKIPAGMVGPDLLVCGSLAGSFVFGPASISRYGFGSFFFLYRICFSFFRTLGPSFCFYFRDVICSFSPMTSSGSSR